jgi:pimeloyl-ACP methyl ester carboxylesterase
MSQKTVVLIHGWGGSFASTWQEPGVTDIVAESGFHVTGIDLLGHGSAEKPHDPAAYTDLPGYLLSQLPSEPVIAVGFSLGALTLARAAVRSPERFTGLCFAGIGDGVFEPHKPEETERILAGLEGRADPSDNIARLFGQYGNRDGNDPAALAAVLKRPPSEAITAAGLSTLNQPALIAIGDKDFAFPSEKLASSLPSSTLKILPRTDHFATPNAFSFIDALVQWLEENFS